MRRCARVIELGLGLRMGILESVQPQRIGCEVRKVGRGAGEWRVSCLRSTHWRAAIVVRSFVAEARKMMSEGMWGVEAPERRVRVPKVLV